nr:ATP-binding protein [uncultured Holophaga sp.]
MHACPTDPLQAYLPETSEAVAILRDGCLSATNEAFSMLLGLPAAALRGQRLEPFLTQRAVRTWGRALIALGGTSQVRELDAALRCDALGQRRRWLLTAFCFEGVPYLQIRTPLPPQLHAQAGENALREREALQTLGRLASGVVHDLNNFFGIVLTTSELMLEQWPEAHPGRERLEAIGQVSRRARDLGRQVLTLARGGDIPPIWFDPARVVEEAGQMLASTAPPAIEIQVRTEEGLQCVGDPVQLSQVVINLGMNAVQAMKDRSGRVELSLGSSGPGTPGTWALLEVRDQGPGIPEDILPKIFEPFYTTRPGGTGIGLPLTRRIVQANGGALEIRSEPERGCHVTVRLPTLRQGQPSASASA